MATVTNPSIVEELSPLVGKVLEAEDNLITITEATPARGGFIVRVQLHAGDDLYKGLKTGKQRLPMTALDENSIDLLQQLYEDSQSFVRRSNGELAGKDEGGNSYTLRVVAGRIRFNGFEERINPKTGEAITGLSSISHGSLEVSSMGAIAKADGFLDEDLLEDIPVAPPVVARPRARRTAVAR